MKKTAAAYPYLLWAVIFTVIPLILVAYYGFTVVDEGGKVTFSMQNFVTFFQNEQLLKAFWRSIYMAVIATVICLVLGYPVAYILAMLKSKHTGFLMLLLIIPMWMNLLLRTYAWVMILDNTGLINSFLNKFGIKSFEFMYHNASIVFGMVYNFLPFMILPIHSILVKTDRSVIEAASDLGADNKKVFCKIIFPLSMPGVFSGITMVFMPAVTTFAISDILSGRKIQLMGNVIESQFLRNYNWHYGSAISLILIVIILFSVIFSSKYEKENEGGGLL